MYSHILNPILQTTSINASKLLQQWWTNYNNLLLMPEHKVPNSANSSQSKSELLAGYRHNLSWKHFAKRWSSQARVCPAPSAQSDASRIFYAAIPKQWITITRLSGASVSKYSTIITSCLNIRRNPRANLSCSNPLGQCKERKRLAFTASKV